MIFKITRQKDQSTIGEHFRQIIERPLPTDELSLLLIVQFGHAKGKKISADVFPGPHSHAVWMVRQEWNKWNIDAFFPMNYNDFYLEKASCNKSKLK